MARERKGAIITRNGDIYARLRFVDDDGKTRSREQKEKNRTEARITLKKWLRDLEEGGPRRVLSEHATFKEIADYYKERKLIPAQYIETQNGKKKIAGLRSLQSPLRWITTLNEHFGRTKMRAITHAAIEDYKLIRLRTQTLGKTQRSITSVNRELELLRAILRFAVRERVISSSPFGDGDSLISKADEHRRERILTYEEEVRLLKFCLKPSTTEYERAGKKITMQPASRNLLKAIIVTALDTAMRRGEILTLTWSDVDFDSGKINILAFNSKTAKARPVGMTPRVREELEKLHEKVRKSPDDRVFGINDNFKKSFMGVCEDAKITGLTFHDLRHTAITRMVQAGIPIPEIMKISGHTQMSTFARYVNPDARAVQHIAERLSIHNDIQLSNVTAKDA